MYIYIYIYLNFVDIIINFINKIRPLGLYYIQIIDSYEKRLNHDDDDYDYDEDDDELGGV